MRASNRALARSQQVLPSPLCAACGTQPFGEPWACKRIDARSAKNGPPADRRAHRMRESPGTPKAIDQHLFAYPLRRADFLSTRGDCRTRSSVVALCPKKDAQEVVARVPPVQIRDRCSIRSAARCANRVAKFPGSAPNAAQFAAGVSFRRNAVLLTKMPLTEKPTRCENRLLRAQRCVRGQRVPNLHQLHILIWPRKERKRRP